jgi:hypothetical protein
VHDVTGYSSSGVHPERKGIPFFYYSGGARGYGWLENGISFMFIQKGKFFGNGQTVFS